MSEVYPNLNGIDTMTFSLLLDQEQNALFPLSELLEHISVPISIYHSVSKRFIWVNDAFLQLSGLTRTDCMDLPQDQFGSWVKEADRTLIKDKIMPVLDQVFHKEIKYESDRMSYKFNIKHSSQKRQKSKKHLLIQTNILNWDENKKPTLHLSLYMEVSGRKFSDKVVLTVKKFNRFDKCWQIVFEDEFTRKPKMLAPREIEVLSCMLKGQSATEIAAFLNISFYTVRAHWRNIMLKTDCHSLKEIRLLALNRGWF